MSTPSLLNIPYLYKAGTLYSQIPESGAGDFTVTRATTPVGGQSTRINKDGLIELVADNVPRLDYPLGGAVNGCPALLVEPSAQNLALQSAGFSVSGTWVPEGTNPTQVTANSTATLDPAGGNTADIITLVSGSTNQLRQSFISTSGTIYTASIFLKNIALTSGQTFLFSTTNQEATINQVNCTIDLANLTITAATQGAGVTVSNAALDNYGNGWYRARFTFSFAVGGTNSFFRLRQPNSVGTNYAFYAWGAQLETGSVATSYIPTTTQPITRGADVISRTSASALIGQTEGTLYAEVDARNFISDSRIFAISDGLIDNAIRLTFESGNLLRGRVRVGGATQAQFTTSALTSGIYKIALAYKADDFAMYVNGTQIGTDTNGAVPTCSQIFLGKNETTLTTNQLNDRIRAAALYTTRLSNAELAALTAP